jgi:serine/threonine protein kinase
LTEDNAAELQRNGEVDIEIKMLNLNEYDIGKRLGKGGQATVKDATHKKNQFKYAIKIFDKQTTDMKFISGPNEG